MTVRNIIQLQHVNDMSVDELVAIDKWLDWCVRFMVVRSAAFMSICQPSAQLMTHQRLSAAIAPAILPACIVNNVTRLRWCYGRYVLDVVGTSSDGQRVMITGNTFGEVEVRLSILRATLTPVFGVWEISEAASKSIRITDTTGFVLRQSRQDPGNIFADCNNGYTIA